MSDALIEAVAKAIAQAALDENEVAATTPLGAFSFSRNTAGDGVLWRSFETDAQAVIAAIEAQGFRVVPVEPTEEMIKALNEYAVCAGYIPEGYAAMLSAAPKITEGT